MMMHCVHTGLIDNKTGVYTLHDDDDYDDDDDDDNGQEDDDN